MLQMKIRASQLSLSDVLDETLPRLVFEALLQGNDWSLIAEVVRVTAGI